MSAFCIFAFYACGPAGTVREVNEVLLVLDIGNTNTVMGIYDDDKLMNRWRLTSRKQTADEVGFMIQGLLSASSIRKENIEAAVFASVVPSLDEMFLEGLASYVGTKCVKVTSDLDIGLEIRMKNPAGIGADKTGEHS